MIVLILCIIICLVSWAILFVYCYRTDPDEDLWGGLVYIFTGIFRVFCYVAFGFAIYNNCIHIESRHQSYLNERAMLVEKLSYFRDYGTEWRKNENAVTQYSNTLNAVSEFNSRVYHIKYNKNDPWIGLFLDKAYIDIEPISIN